MSRFGKNSETESKVAHNERLEFLGDAVVEFVTSVHLFHMFPDLEEGGLATYRAALVQNQHLVRLNCTWNIPNQFHEASTRTLPRNQNSRSQNFP